MIMWKSVGLRKTLERYTISFTESLGYYELKQNKRWFEEVFSIIGSKEPR